MSAWLDWATSGADPGSVFSVCGCVALLLPLLLIKNPRRPVHYVSHAHAAQEYLRRFRGHPTSVLAALSRDNLQAASHIGKELSLSKLTYDGLMYASTVAFKDAITGKDSGGSQKAKKRSDPDEDVPQAFLGMERSQAFYAAIIERMCQTNDQSVLKSMQQQQGIRSQTRWAFGSAFLAHHFTSSLPPAHTLALATTTAANAAATEAIQTPVLWGITAHTASPLLASLGLPAVAITPVGWGVPVAPAAAALFALRVWMMRALHIPSPLWDRIMHQAVVRRERAAVRAIRASEHYVFTGAAADMLAMLTVAALTSATDGASVATTVFGVLILHTIAAIKLASPEPAADLTSCREALDMSQIPAEALRARLTLRLAQAMQFSQTLADLPHLAAAGRAASGSDGAGAAHQAHRTAQRGGDGVITGKAFADEVQEPWAADDAECLQALAGGAWRSAPRVATGVDEEESFLAALWPSRSRPRCVLGAAHARLHAERALAVISITLASTADSGTLSTAPLAPADGPAVRFQFDDAVILREGLPGGAVSTTCLHQLHGRGGDQAVVPLLPLMRVRWLLDAVCAAEQLLDFLGESTADIGALEFHRGAVNMYAAVGMNSLRTGGSGTRTPRPALSAEEQQLAELSELQFLSAARAACERALDWTPFAAVAQRGRIHQMLADVAELQGDRPAALRHAVRATKCLQGDLAVCSRAAQLWRDPAVRAHWRRPAPGSSADPPQAPADPAPAVAPAGHSQPPALWAEKEALEPDAARAMLYIEEAQRLAKLKKSG